MRHFALEPMSLSASAGGRRAKPERRRNHAVLVNTNSYNARATMDTSLMADSRGVTWAGGGQATRTCS